MAFSTMYSELVVEGAELSAATTRIWLGRCCVVRLDGHAGMRRMDVPRLRGRVELLQTRVHQVQREADHEGRNHDADDQRNLLQPRRGANDVTGLQVLRSVA